MGFRIRVHTASGSAYVLDRDVMTWERLNVNVGHEDIPGYEGIKAGTLLEFPEPQVGRGMMLAVDDGTTVFTTQVVRIEDVSD